MAHHPSMVLGDVQAHRTNLVGAAAVPTHGEGQRQCRRMERELEADVFSEQFSEQLSEQLGRVCKIWLQEGTGGGD